MMKRLLIVVGVLMIFLVGCGGSGGADPGITNLTKLSGVWDYAFNCEGYIQLGDEQIPWNVSVNGYYDISPTTVIDDEGHYWTWSYDGVTLKLQRTYIDTGWDPDLGDYYQENTIKLQGYAPPSYSVVTIIGSITGSIICDAAAEPISANSEVRGNIAKR